VVELNNPVRRRTRDPFGHYKKRIVVELSPGDMLVMHLERDKTVYRASLHAVFRQMALWHADAERDYQTSQRKIRRTE
jgi:hypothetical protein